MTNANRREQLVRLNLIWCLGVIFLLILVELWGRDLLVAHGFWARFIQVKSLQSISVKQPEPRSYYQERISQESWRRLPDSQRQYQEALLWTMNRVGKIEPNPRWDPVALLKGVEAGEGTLCSGMASLYQNVLAAIGRPSREIVLIRNPFNCYDTHATVEVWLDGKWVILDPTFGIYYINSTGELLSAQELKQYLFEGREAEVKPVSIGKVTYPARIENYYINYLLLYNNVFVMDWNPNRIARIPPFCYWFGSRLYYEKLPLESDTHIRFIQQLYFIFTIVVPGFIFVMILILVGLCYKSKQLINFGA